MGFSYLIIGFIFLLNPDIMVFDVMPDLVGYCFILKGLYKGTKVNSDFELSFKYFKWLLYISIVKLPIYFFALTTVARDPFIFLLCTSIFGTIDAIACIFAFNAFFEGLATSATFSNYVDVTKCSVFNGYDALKKTTTVFFIVKPLMYLIPELTRLSDSKYGEVTSTGIIGLFEFYTLFIVVCAIVCLIFGINWFVKIKKYVKGIIADKVYIGSLEEKYEVEYAQSALKREKDLIFIILFILNLAFIFSIALRFDGVNYIPPAISAVLFLISALFIKKLGIDTKKLRNFSIVYLVYTTAITVANSYFISTFFVSDEYSVGLTVSFVEQLKLIIRRDFNALYAFIVLCVLFAIGAVMLGYLLFKFMGLLRQINQSYCTKKQNEEFDIYVEEDVLTTRKLFGAQKILAIASVVCEALQYALWVIFPAFWIAGFISQLAFVIVSSLLISKIRDNYKAKNYLE